ncbi:MAG: hypothetical protein ABFQ53_03910 [Patescibacteria group bacterium]
MVFKLIVPKWLIFSNEKIAIKNIVRVMESVCELKVPLVVDTETGDNWGEL